MKVFLLIILPILIFIIIFAATKLILTKFISIMIKPVISNCDVLSHEIILTALHFYKGAMKASGNSSRYDVVQDIINNLQFD